MSIRSLKSTSSYYPEKCTLVLMEEYYGHRRRLVLREFAPFELATAQSRDPACVQPAGSTLGRDRQRAGVGVGEPLRAGVTASKKSRCWPDSRSRPRSAT